MRWSVLIAALVLLDAAITFHNVWPTPGVGWSGALSIELAFCLLAGAATGRIAPVPLALLWVVLAIGRYADVTAPALWGREINFYWDLRFLPDVVAMFARAASTPLVWLGIVGGTLLLVATYLLFKRSFAIIRTALSDRHQRRLLAAAAAVVVVLFVWQRMHGAGGIEPVAMPVTEVYARQLRFAARAISGTAALPASPSFDGDLARVQDADVLLFFIESYGAVAFERPDLVARVDANRRALAQAIEDSGQQVASAYVESPTFGGSSWFAHITLLSGIEIGDPDANALLMTANRDTLPKAFARRGFRSIAMMPALSYPWPEGAFYGFADVLNGERLGYRGPPFGWWNLSDQFALARLDDGERNRTPRAPLFVFFPTISTHTPFVPVPPYQPDWSRMLSDQPYEPDDLDRAYGQQPDWLNLSPSYAEAVDYAYQTLAGYLRRHAGEEFVMILIGDHQPPALVSGEGATWDVPVHVITRRRDILDALLGRGFRSGIAPVRPTLGKMHTLTPMLMDAFSSTR